MSDKDKRKRIDNEKIKDFYIRAILKLSKEDFDDILCRFQKQYTNTECIVFTSKKTLRNFIESVFYEYLLCIDIANTEKTYFSSWQYHKKDFELEKDLYLKDKTFNTEQVGEKQNLKSCIFAVVKEMYIEKPYRCHYWRYDEKDLLPNSVITADFITNPADCKALENIFALCNRENIKQEFQTQNRRTATMKIC